MENLWFEIHYGFQVLLYVRSLANCCGMNLREFIEHTLWCDFYKLTGE